METPVNLFIIIVTCVISFLGFNNPKLVENLLFFIPAIRRGHQYYRFITHGFVHADIAHLAFNMITLYFFGGLIESEITRATGSPIFYLLFYLMGLVIAILPTYIKKFNTPNYASLGASGAVSAVLFAFILLKPWSIIFVFFIPAPAIIYGVFYVGYSIWMDKQNRDNTNHSAHLSGAIFGILFMFCMEPKIFLFFLNQLANPRFFN